MSLDRRAVAAVIGGGVALAAGAAFAGYQLAQWRHRKAHALDVVEELLGSPPSSGSHAKFVDDHSTGAPHSHSHHHGGSLLAHIDSDAPSSPTVVAVGGAGGAGASTGGMSTPSRRTKSHEDVRPDSVFPTGGALVAGAAADPMGLRRKMSLERRRGAPVIIGVAGASGSGKTSIAELIAERLSDQVVLSISSDNYYKTLGPGVNPADYNFDHPASIDFDLLAEHLERLRGGLDVDVPNYDFVHHRRTDKTTHVSGAATTVIIVDGIFVLWAERVRAQCDVTLFCLEDMDVCLARRLRRDIVERGRTVESVLTQYLRFVKAGFESFVAPSMAFSDVIIPRAKQNVTAIELLARDIQRRCDAGM